MSPVKNMYQASSIKRIITTMDGVPVCKDDGRILCFLDTASCRYNAKIRTFKYKLRHHSRGLTKHQFFRAQKERHEQGYISMGTLGRKGD
ncbi:MAG: hypothetical protein NZL83_03585 [Candidatus Absconditabacterales bacterium]|nr:hypothetical protein [Candidatus Absconditabacterales bacterium]